MSLDHLLLMSSQKVWVSDSSEGFRLGHIVDLGSDRVSVSLDGANNNKPGSGPLQVPYESVYPAEDDSEQDYDDNCSLMYLNEATLLNNIRVRFNKNQIYVRKTVSEIEKLKLPINHH